MPVKSSRRTIERPHNRLTRLSALMLDALEASPESDDSGQAIVLLSSGVEKAIALYGYENDSDAIADLLLHIQGIMHANGKVFKVVIDGEQVIG